MGTVLQTGTQKQRFLDALREFGFITAAAKVAGICRSQVYRWQEHDEQFAEAFKEAELAAIETAEAELYRRGVHGWERPVYQNGKNVGSLFEKDTVALIVYLKAHKREKYGDRLDVRMPQQIIRHYGPTIDVEALLRPQVTSEQATEVTR